MRGVALALALVLVASVAFPGCGDKPSAKAIENVKSQWAALEPARKRLAAIQAALPAPGKEQEVACPAPVDGDKLAMIGESRLRRLVEGGASADVDRKERYVERNVPFFMPQGEYDAVLASGKLTGVANNLRAAKRDFEALEHLVVYRPTDVVVGKIGAVTGKEFAIDQLAKWQGWAFVYQNAEPPRLVCAFQVSAETPPDLRLAVEKGHRPGDWQLLEDVSRNVRKSTLARLARPGGAAE